MGRPKKVMADDPKTEGTIRCLVMRDFWPTENEEDRVRAGTMIEVTAEEALDGIEIGTLSRVK